MKKLLSGVVVIVVVTIFLMGCVQSPLETSPEKTYDYTLKVLEGGEGVDVEFLKKEDQDWKQVLKTNCNLDGVCGINQEDLGGLQTMDSLKILSDVRIWPFFADIVPESKQDSIFSILAVQRIEVFKGLFQDLPAEIQFNPADGGCRFFLFRVFDPGFDLSHGQYLEYFYDARPFLAQLKNSSGQVLQSFEGWTRGRWIIFTCSVDFDITNIELQTEIPEMVISSDKPRGNTYSQTLHFRPAVNDIFFYAPFMGHN